jgi:hypothetical protein
MRVRVRLLGWEKEWKGGRLVGLGFSLAHSRLFLSVDLKSVHKRVCLVQEHCSTDAFSFNKKAI